MRWVQILVKAFCVSLRTNILGKGIVSISSSPPVSGKAEWILANETCLREGKLWIQTNCYRLCHILLVVEGLGKYVHTKPMLMLEEHITFMHACCYIYIYIYIYIYGCVCVCECVCVCVCVWLYMYNKEQ